MKKLVWLGMFVGGGIGSYVPLLWGAGAFSFSSVICGALGSILGIWAGYRLAQW